MRKRDLCYKIISRKEGFLENLRYDFVGKPLGQGRNYSPKDSETLI